MENATDIYLYIFVFLFLKFLSLCSNSPPTTFFGRVLRHEAHDAASPVAHIFIIRIGNDVTGNSLDDNDDDEASQLTDCFICAKSISIESAICVRGLKRCSGS